MFDHFIQREAIDVDLYTGALSEKPMEGAIIGPLLSCLVTDQFLRIKKGDKYWYERPVGPQRFSIGNSTVFYIFVINANTISKWFCR